MTVYLDPPRWPRHGTVWGHLISDRDLGELHDAARRGGLPARAFDLDHYDYPERARESLLRAGAVAVPGGRLVRILLASGLRIPKRDRPAADRARLASDWPGEAADRPRELLRGAIGHTRPLPDSPGAYRLECDEERSPRIEARDESGRRAAERALDVLDRQSYRDYQHAFIGMVTHW